MKLFFKDSVFPFVFIIFLQVLALADPAAAQTITQTRRLSFGTIVVADPGSTPSMEIAPNGAINAIDPGLYSIDPPDGGEYSFTGGTPNADYDITFEPSITLNGGGAADFVIDNFVASPATIHTDAFGDATFSVGARLTAQNGAAYADGTYDGTLDITLTIDN